VGSRLLTALLDRYLLAEGEGDLEGDGLGVGVGLATPLERALLVVLRPGVRIGPGPSLAK
jgi:hypothetical protein